MKNLLLIVKRAQSHFLNSHWNRASNTKRKLVHTCQKCPYISLGQFRKSWRLNNGEGNPVKLSYECSRLKGSKWDKSGKARLLIWRSAGQGSVKGDYRTVGIAPSLTRLWFIPYLIISIHTGAVDILSCIINGLTLVWECLHN